MIEKKIETKLCGVIVDEYLALVPHIILAAKKKAGCSPLLYELRKCLSPENFKLVCDSLVYPSLTYCIKLWVVVKMLG